MREYPCPYKASFHHTGLREKKGKKKGRKEGKGGGKGREEGREGKKRETRVRREVYLNEGSFHLLISDGQSQKAVVDNMSNECHRRKLELLL